MKRLIFILLLLTNAAFAFAQDGFEKATDLGKTKGIVKMIGDSYVIEDAANNGKRWVAVNMPEEFKKEGLEVTFSGEEGVIPPNVRLMGTPLKLEKIAVTCKVKKKMKLNKRKYKF